jgi:hypothetical protein
MEKFTLIKRLFPDKYLLDNIDLGEFLKIDISDLEEESFLWGRELIFNLSNCLFRERRMYEYNQRTKSFYKAIDELIVEDQDQDIIDFSILKLNGVGGSKSDGYKNMYEFAYSLDINPKYISYPIKFQTKQDCIKNIKEVDEEYILIHQHWNNRFYLINRDHSHHLAAIYRQCSEQNRDFLLKCKIRNCKINQNSIKFITNNYYSFCYRNESRYEELSTLLILQLGIHIIHIKDDSGRKKKYYLFIPKKYKYGDVVNRFLGNHAEFFYDLNAYFLSLRSGDGNCENSGGDNCVYKNI